MKQTPPTLHTPRISPVRSRRLRPALGSASLLLLLCGGAHAQTPSESDDVDAELERLEESTEAPAASQNAPEAPPAEADGAPGPSAGADSGPAGEPAGASTAATPEDEGLDEVIVTADRRRKSLQDYSGVAQAFSQNKLQQVGVTRVEGLAQMVPGLQIGQQEGNTEVFIRGVGNDNNTEVGDMGVALHLDGVYLPRPRGVGQMFFDVERVEVASGPQGTLRGRNAMGGSIDIVTAKPKLGEFGAYAQATFGTFAERRYEGMVNIPLGDTVAVRAAGFSSRHDPHWQNAGPLNDLRASQDEDAWAMRVQAKWEPTPKFSVVAGYDYVREGGTGYIGANHFAPLTYEDPDDQDTVPDPVLPDEIDNPRRVYQIGHQARQNMNHQGGRLTVNWDLGPFAVEALGSYRDLKYTQYTGGSAGVIYDGFNFEDQGTDFFGGAYWLSQSQSEVFELRAFAPEGSRLQWTAGVFGLLEQQQVVLQQNSDPIEGYGGGEFNMPNVDGNAYAAYADATFSVTDKFRIIAGTRFTAERKSRFDGLGMQLGGAGNLGRYGTEGFEPRYLDRTLYSTEDALADLRQEDLGPRVRAGIASGQYTEDRAREVAARVNLFLDGVGSFGARDEVASNLCEVRFNQPPGQPAQNTLTRNDSGGFRCTNGVNPDLVANNGFAIGPQPQNAEITNNFLDWRAGVEYDLADESLLYATVSTAHKAAGYNDNISTNVNFDLYYGPESVVSYELGSKNTLADRRLRLNGAFFFYQYNDQVFQQIVQTGEVDPTTGQASTNALRRNAASSNVYGLDLNVVYALPLGLEAELHALVLDARYGEGTLVSDSRIGFGVSRYEVDIEGNWLPRASRYTLNYSLSQVLYTSFGRFNWIAQAQTRSKHHMTVFNGKFLPEANDRTPGELNFDTTDDANDRFPGEADYVALQQNPARLTDEVPAYTRVDLGVGWTHPDGRISLTGYVNNLVNTTYATSIIATPNLNLRFFNAPRTAGVRFRVDW